MFSMEKENNLLLQLIEFEENCICKVCNQKWDKPVRLKTCGHYFCSSCLDKSLNSCPTCKKPFSPSDIDNHNLAALCEPIFKQLKISFTDKFETIIMFEEEILCLNFVDFIPVKQNLKGEAQIHIAAKKGFLGEVKHHIKAGTDINHKDYAGWTPLHEAICNNHVSVIQCLLNSGASVNVPNNEYITPLHQAIFSDNVEIVQILLCYNPYRTSKDLFGKTPLDYASARMQELMSRCSHDYKCVRQVYFRKKVTAFCQDIRPTKIIDLNDCEDVNLVKEFVLEKYKYTHLIINKTAGISMPLLLSMLAGYFVVNEEWIDSFLKDRCYVKVDLDAEIVTDATLNAGIKSAILNRVLLRPKLFDRISFFLIESVKKVPVYGFTFSRNQIIQLIQTGGGLVVGRAPTPNSVACERRIFPYHVENIDSKGFCRHFIIYGDTYVPQLQYRMPDLKHRDVKWLIDCIINFKIRYSFDD